MTDEAQANSFNSLIIAGAVIVAGALAYLFWPKTPEPVVETPPPVIEPAPVIVEAEPEPEPEPEVFEATPTPEAVEIDPDADIEPMPEPVEPEPEPVDISDAAIESALVMIANSDVITALLVNEDLLQRFVVTITNLADEEMAPNHRLLKPPIKLFRVYQQADRQWIDPASYKRYTPYVEAMELLENARLITLFDRYEEDITSIFEEISSSSQQFDEVMVDAIDNLLDTPEVPMPVEVFTDSVMFKYKDEKLENLNAPQKQLLRTGPDNMRRIKAKLREIRELLLSRESE